jgi:hypothetical protein
VRKKLPPRNSILIIEEMCVLVLRERMCHVGGRNSYENEGEKRKINLRKWLCDGFVTI